VGYGRGGLVTAAGYGQPVTYQYNGSPGQPAEMPGHGGPAAVPSGGPFLVYSSTSSSHAAVPYQDDVGDESDDLGAAAQFQDA
jgi:hypothetical protein